MQGIIIKGIGGFYYVYDSNKVYECKARGKFRIDNKKPLPGDQVEFEIDENQKGYLLEILERKNQMIRPSIANIDQMIIVLACSNPIPDFFLLDKMIITCKQKKIIPIVCINKADECDSALKNQIIEDCKSAKCKYVLTSSKTSEGIEDLRLVLKDNVTCLCGQSAVGKTSLIKALTGRELETGELSEKTKRGRHTTRASELIMLDNHGLIVDTPGFSTFDVDNLDFRQIKDYYAEFEDNNCYFKDCMHIDEPKCEIKIRLENGEISKNRYARYVKIVEQIMQKENKYD